MISKILEGLKKGNVASLGFKEAELSELAKPYATLLNEESTDEQVQSVVDIALSQLKVLQPTIDRQVEARVKAQKPAEVQPAQPQPTNVEQNGANVEPQPNAEIEELKRQVEALTLAKAESDKATAKANLINGIKSSYTDELSKERFDAFVDIATIDEAADAATNYLSISAKFKAYEALSMDNGSVRTPSGAGNAIDENEFGDLK